MHYPIWTYPISATLPMNCIEEEVIDIRRRTRSLSKAEKNFAINLCFLRRAHELTQKEMAAIVDPKLSRNTYAAWESSGNLPSLKHQRILANFFQYSVEELFQDIITGRRSTAA